MTRATPQEIYAAAQELKAATPLTRAFIFGGMGGEFFPADPEPRAMDEFTWTVRLHGLTGKGCSESAAITDWIKAAEAHHTATRTARATDGRPDCPYNGAAALPPVSTRVAEAV